MFPDSKNKNFYFLILLLSQVSIAICNFLYLQKIDENKNIKVVNEVTEIKEVEKKVPIPCVKCNEAKEKKEEQEEQISNFINEKEQSEERLTQKYNINPLKEYDKDTGYIWVKEKLPTYYKREDDGITISII